MLEKVNEKLRNFQEMIGYEFKNDKLLKQALTTPQLGNELGIPHYDILETLGDPVLKLILSLKIFNEKEANPKNITRLKQMLENDKKLSEIGSKYFYLEKYIFSSKEPGELKKTKILADVLEALCGALFLDSSLDLKVVEEIIINRFYKDRDELIKGSTIFNKNELLEFLQERYRITPKIIAEFTKIPPDHDLKWIAHDPKVCDDNGKVILSFVGLRSIENKSKKEAESDLFRKIHEKLKNN